MAVDRTDELGHVEEVPAVDLAPVDPTGEANAFDQRVRNVMEDARFELARRRQQIGLFGTMPARWNRVAWPAAAAVALASLAVLRTSAPALAAVDEVTVEEEMALAFGVPEALAVWVAEPESPQLTEILVGWEQEE